MKKTLKLSGRMREIPVNSESGLCDDPPAKLTANQIVDGIWNGSFSQDELHRINDAVRAAYRAEREDRLTQAQHALRNGSVVMLKGIRPKKLIGITGIVEGFRPGAKRADLKVTDAHSYTGYSKGAVVRGIPLVCFEIIPQNVLDKAGWIPNGE